ncbi:MAG: class I adenylate-forming enzyme family protein [Myxococcota bacterium]
MPASSTRGAASTFLTWLTQNAERSPHKVFIHSIDQNTAITHAEMLRLCHQIGNYLAARGVRANDRVALLSHNSLEHVAAYLGVMAYGATICTIHLEMNSLHLPDILRALQPRWVLVEGGLGVDALRAEAPGEWMPLGTWGRGDAETFFAEVSAQSEELEYAPINDLQDIAAIFYTSGTASRPKGVACSFAELYENTQPTAEALGITASDRVLDFRSFNWMSAQVLSALGPLYKGATLLLARKFSRRHFLEWVRDHRATIAAGNPTTLNMLTSQPVDVRRAQVPDLRFITSSSAPLLRQDWLAFEEMYGIPVAQGYGSSETGWIAASNEHTRRLGSVGRPFPYQNVAVVGEKGESLPPKAVGAIEVGRGPDAEYRYLGEDGTLRLSATGRIRTGDMGYLDEDGYLYVTGRTRDLIIRGGVNIAPVEIDNIICELRDVAEAAAVGVPDRIYGEQVIAYVAPKPDAALKAEEVLAHCRARLADAKVPKEILFRPSLPKTDRGKLDRSALVADWTRTKSS